MYGASLGAQASPTRTCKTTTTPLRSFFFCPLRFLCRTTHNDDLQFASLPGLVMTVQCRERRGTTGVLSSWHNFLFLVLLVFCLYFLTGTGHVWGGMHKAAIRGASRSQWTMGYEYVENFSIRIVNYTPFNTVRRYSAKSVLPCPSKYRLASCLHADQRKISFVRLSLPSM